MKTYNRDPFNASANCFGLLHSPPWGCQTSQRTIPNNVKGTNKYKCSVSISLGHWLFDRKFALKLEIREFYGSHSVGAYSQALTFTNVYSLLHYLTLLLKYIYWGIKFIVN